MSQPGLATTTIVPGRFRDGAIWLAAMVALLSLCLGPAPAARAATPDEYRQVVTRALDAVAGAVDADERERTRVGQEASALLAGVGSVRLSDGQALTPADPALAAALGAGDLTVARAQLAALLHALDVAATAPGPSPDAGAQLAAILARPEFRPPEPNVAERLLAPLVEPLRLAWERFWRGLRARLDTPAAGGTNLVLLVVGVLVVAGLGALLAGAFAGNVVSGAQTVGDRAAGLRAPRASRERAYELAAGGHYRAALHELNLATLLALDERRVLRYQPELTNREHAASARVDAVVRAALGPLVELYDRLWYSGSPVTAEDWRHFAVLADACAASASDSAPTRPPEPTALAGAR
jgi:hypothetical protein